MRKLIAFVICLGLFLSTAPVSYGVDKTDKKVQTKKVVKKKATSKTAKKSVKAKYDNFIDKNQNGVDDRKEKLVAKKKAKGQKTDKNKSDKKTVRPKKSEKSKKPEKPEKSGKS